MSTWNCCGCGLENVWTMDLCQVCCAVKPNWMSLNRKQQTQLLIFGYINKQNDLYHDLELLPIEIIKLIELFYDVYIYWNIKQDEMQKLDKMQNGKRFSSKTSFKINGIEFKFVLYPNGGSSKDIGRVQFGVHLKHLPSDIQYVGFYLESECQTNHRIHKQMIKCDRSAKAGSYMMESSQLKQLKCIHFNCFIDIKYIKYKTKMNKEPLINYSMKMMNASKYKWNINETLMKYCKTMGSGESIYSHTFDNVWCLLLFPNINGEVHVLLNCLLLPYGLNKMKIKYKIIINDGDHKSKQIMKHFRAGQLAFGWNVKTLSLQTLKEMNSMSINVKLQVLNIYNDDDQIIDEVDWSKYDIVDK